MARELRETRLPGVGVKYTCLTAHGGKLTVILHNEGQRELYWFPHDGDEEPQAVIQLEDDEARQLGAIFGGAFDRPKIVEELEMAFGELSIECSRRTGDRLPPIETLVVGSFLAPTVRMPGGVIGKAG